MTSRQDPGIGGIREPKHELARGMHEEQRHRIGPDGRDAEHRTARTSRWARFVRSKTLR